MKKTDIKVLYEAMHLLALDIHCEDGVATAAITEAADRLREAMCVILARIPVQCRMKERRFDRQMCIGCGHYGLCDCLGGYEYA